MPTGSVIYQAVLFWMCILYELFQIKLESIWLNSLRTITWISLMVNCMNMYVHWGCGRRVFKWWGASIYVLLSSYIAIRHSSILVQFERWWQIYSTHKRDTLHYPHVKAHNHNLTSSSVVPFCRHQSRSLFAFYWRDGRTISIGLQMPTLPRTPIIRLMNWPM